ncbi:hypothetical protein N9O57_01645 [bacterium]|nr:hypothetical protein [bacterium]
MADPDYKFEKFEEYFGDEKQVKKIIDECELCSAKLVHTHLSDYKNLLIGPLPRVWYRQSKTYPYH